MAVWSAEWRLGGKECRRMASDRCLMVIVGVCRLVSVLSVVCCWCVIVGSVLLCILLFFVMFSFLLVFVFCGSVCVCVVFWLCL